MEYDTYFLFRMRNRKFLRFLLDIHIKMKPVT